MAKIEALLSLLADYHFFTDDKSFQVHSASPSELSEEELTLISAAKGPLAPNTNGSSENLASSIKKSRKRI